MVSQIFFLFQNLNYEGGSRIYQHPYIFTQATRLSANDKKKFTKQKKEKVMNVISHLVVIVFVLVVRLVAVDGERVLPQQKASPRKTQIVFPGNGHGLLEK